jgi:4-alpha-glucanotransferase
MFIELLRNNLRYGGALRLDHVMTLFRLFWIPRGMPATAGTYVRYPWEDLLGILALESVRHRAVIIGEDLGTVPDFVREKLASFGVLSYRVFYFERNAAGEWKRPHEYPNDAIAVISTHDLPTLAGYWATEDIELRFKLGLFSDEDAYRRALDDRRRDKERILQVLRHEGLLPDGSEGWLDSRHVPPELSDAIHAYLARTPSRLMMTSCEDLIGDRTQINVPGTFDSYPNWSLKVPVTLRELQADPRPGRLASLLETIRPSD